MAVASGRAGMVLGWYGFYLTTFLSRLNLHELLRVEDSSYKPCHPKEVPKATLHPELCYLQWRQKQFLSVFSKDFPWGGNMP